MEERLIQDQITPEMARAELERRQAARMELQRRLNEKKPQDLSGDFSSLNERLGQFSANLPRDIGVGLGQLGHSLINAPHNIANMISPSLASHIPSQKNYDYAQMLDVPNTGEDKFAQDIAKNSLAMMSPAADLKLLGTGIKAIPKVGEFLASAASRILPQAGIGAITNENPAEGAKHSALVQSIIEGIPVAGKAIKGSAELINPKASAGKLVDSIKARLGQAKDLEKEAYEPFNKISENYSLGKPKNLLSDIEKYEPHFGYNVNKYYGIFKDKDTLKNAHDLQGAMFKEIKSERSKLDPDNNKILALEDARENLKKDIITRLEKINPKVADEYKRGAFIHTTEVRPYTSNQELSELVKNKSKDVQPTKLISAIEKSVKKGYIPEQHYLQNALNEMKAKVNRGNLYSTIAGAGVGGLLHPGLSPTLSAIGGATLGKMFGPRTAEFLQNPELEKALEKLTKYGKYAAPAARGILD